MHLIVLIKKLYHSELLVQLGQLSEPPLLPTALEEPHCSYSGPKILRKSKEKMVLIHMFTPQLFLA